MALVPDVMQPASEIEHKHAQGKAARMSWARLLKRVFDIERCACGGQPKIVAAIEDPVVIVSILTHLELPARAPPRGPARELSLNHAA